MATFRAHTTHVIFVPDYINRSALITAKGLNSKLWVCVTTWSKKVRSLGNHFVSWLISDGLFAQSSGPCLGKLANQASNRQCALSWRIAIVYAGATVSPLPSKYSLAYCHFTGHSLYFSFDREKALRSFCHPLLLAYTLPMTHLGAQSLGKHWLLSKWHTLTYREVRPALMKQCKSVVQPIPQLKQVAYQMRCATGVRFHCWQLILQVVLLRKCSCRNDSRDQIWIEYLLIIALQCRLFSFGSPSGSHQSV